MHQPTAGTDAKGTISDWWSEVNRLGLPRSCLCFFSGNFFNISKKVGGQRSKVKIVVFYMTFQLKFSNFNQKSDRILKLNLSNLIFYIPFSGRSIVHTLPTMHPDTAWLDKRLGEQRVSFSTFSVPNSLESSDCAVTLET